MTVITFGGHIMAYTIEQAYQDYETHITTEILNNFGGSYATLQTIRETWHTECQYTISMCDFLVAKSQDFFATMPEKETTCTDPNFLRALTKRMAKYLVPYTIRKMTLPEDRVERKQAVNREKKALLKRIYEGSCYIQALQIRLEAQRAAKKSGNGQKTQKARKYQKAKRVYNDVQGLFTEARTYRKAR